MSDGPTVWQAWRWWLAHVLAPAFVGGVAGWVIGRGMADALSEPVTATIVTLLLINLLVVSPWLRARRRKRKEAGDG